jgi:hypothetical protein
LISQEFKMPSKPALKKGATRSVSIKKPVPKAVPKAAKKVKPFWMAPAKDGDD